MPWSDWIPATLSGRQPPRNVYGIYAFGRRSHDESMDILYIGRARCGQTTIYDRVRRHLQSYGSNGIYNLSKDPNVELYVRWRVASLGEDPAQLESAALEDFIKEHGRLPEYNRKNEKHQRFSDSLLARFRLSAQTAELGVMGAFCLLSGVIASGFTILFRTAWT